MLKTTLSKLPKLRQATLSIFVYSHESNVFLPVPRALHQTFGYWSATSEGQIRSDLLSKKTTSTDVNLIMCGRKSQETNGERAINSSQLATAQPLMPTLKLCRGKKKGGKKAKRLSIKETVLFYTDSVFSTGHSHLPEWHDDGKDDCGWLAFRTYICIFTFTYSGEPVIYWYSMFH